MATQPLQSRLFEEIRKLPDQAQRRVLEFVNSLTNRSGEPGANLIASVGMISAQDLEEMKKAIEEGCEQVDSNGW